MKASGKRHKQRKSIIIIIIIHCIVYRCTLDGVGVGKCNKWDAHSSCTHRCTMYKVVHIIQQYMYNMVHIYNMVVTVGV